MCRSSSAITGAQIDKNFPVVRRKRHGMPGVALVTDFRPGSRQAVSSCTHARCARVHRGPLTAPRACCRYIGVDKIFLRENGNTSSIQAEMQPYVQAGVVDFGLIDGPKHPTQTNWFNACSKMAQPAYSWVAFVDMDEFIVVLNKCALPHMQRLLLCACTTLNGCLVAAPWHLRSTFGSLQLDTALVCYPVDHSWQLQLLAHEHAAHHRDTLCRQKAVTERNALKSLLRKSFRYTAAVSMQWVLFGAGGHKAPPAEGQLKGFNKCTGVLSKQMKCLGNSYWFHNKATFRPMHVHQCNFRFGAVSVLGNSEPLNMWRVKMIPSSDDRGPFGASNAGHLSEAEHKFFTQITNDYQIVLFHYVTRSQEDFVQRKINRRSGVYATQFAALQKADGGELDGLQLDAQYAAFEHQHGFDGDHSVCQQGGAIADAMADARSKRGWSELKNG